jgi:hypothetical protein
MKELYRIAITVFTVVVCLALVSGLGSSPSVASPPASGPGLRLARIVKTKDAPPVRIPPPADFGRRAPTASIFIHYIESGTPYGDTCTTMPSGAKTAIAYAASLAAAQFTSSVPTVIDACWVTGLDEGTLGVGGAVDSKANFIGAPVPNTWYADALANALHGSDLDPAKHEIYIGSNATRPDWYFGVDAQPPSNQYDLVTTAYHEIFHGLGFLDTFRYSGGTGVGVILQQHILLPMTALCTMVRGNSSSRVSRTLPPHWEANLSATISSSEAPTRLWRMAVPTPSCMPPILGERAPALYTLIKCLSRQPS